MQERFACSQSEVKKMTTAELREIFLIRDSLTEPLGFTDQFLIRTDKNRSWVIEGDEKLKNVLTFALADKGIVFRNETTRQQPVKVPAP